MLFECKLCRYTPGPKGAYMCFVQVARPKINISQPELKFADIAKVGPGVGPSAGDGCG